jgi:Microtubule-binding stalk of dynein motor
MVALSDQEPGTGRPPFPFHSAGLSKIRQAAEAVSSLQTALAEEKIVVEEKKAATQTLIESIGRERAVVEASRADEEAAAALQAEVTAFQNECAADLALAEPIIKVLNERGGGRAVNALVLT